MDGSVPGSMEFHETWLQMAAENSQTKGVIVLELLPDFEYHYN